MLLLKHNIAMIFSITLLLLVGICDCQSLAELHKALKEKHSDIVHNMIAKATEPPKPALAEYETFHQSKKVNYIVTEDGKLIHREFRRLSVADAMNRIKGIVDPEPDIPIP